jgi:large subunit ribosomal protein L25
MLSLKAFPKTKKGRVVGFLPAILYGPNVKNRAFFIKESDFLPVFKKAGETQVVKVSFDDGQTYDTLIHDYQIHPLHNKIIHVDFYAFKKGKEIVVKVPIEFVGESPAVKELGGIFVISAREIEVQCQATNIPAKLTVDISKLKKIHDEISIKDIVFPEGVAPKQKLETIIASVVPPRREEQELKSGPEQPPTATQESTASGKTQVTNTEPEELKGKGTPTSSAKSQK